MRSSKDFRFDKRKISIDIRLTPFYLLCFVTKNTKGRSRRVSGKRRGERRDDHQRAPMMPALSKNVFGFPTKLVAKLRYCDIFQITSTTGSIAKEVLNINSTFDPDQTGTGHQPMYRDTYAGIYDQYAVISAKAYVTFVSNATTSAMLVGTVIDDDSSTSSVFQTLCEQSTGEHYLIPNATGSLNNHRFVVNWDCKKHLGIDPYSSESYKTPVGSNPTEISTLLCWAYPADGSSTTTTTVFVELEQTVLWTELSTPTQS